MFLYCFVIFVIFFCLNAFNIFFLILLFVLCIGVKEVFLFLNMTNTYIIRVSMLVVIYSTLRYKEEKNIKNKIMQKASSCG